MSASSARLKLYRGKYAAVWSDEETGQTQRASLGTEDRAEAERRFEDWKKALAGQTDTVGEIVTAYMADKADRVSHVKMTFAWKALAPTFKNIRPDQVTREKSRVYVAARRKQGRKDGTIRGELGVLISALRWQNPNTPAVVELPPEPRPRERHLTREEYKRLVAAAGSPHVRLFIILALATAGRSRALLELTWDRVDFERGLITLATDAEGPRKGRATVPMTAAAREALEEAKKAATSDFVIEWAGEPVGSIKKGFCRAVKNAKLKDVSPHVLRHTAAVWMAEAGVSMSVIAQYLGHNNDKITQKVYARFSPGFMADAAKALE